jgi:hypothetical protein
MNRAIPHRNVKNNGVLVVLDDYVGFLFREP